MDIDDTNEEGLVLNDIDKEIEVNNSDKEQQDNIRRTDSSMDKYKRSSNYA